MSTTSYVSSMQDTNYSGTNANVAGHFQQPQSDLFWASNLWSDTPRDLPKLLCFLTLYNLTLSLKERHCLALTHEKTASKCNVRRGVMIALLLLLSGDVQSNPGPELQCIQTPADLNLMSGLKCIHLNVRSLVPKMDMVRIWVKSTDADIVVISETWLTKSITNEDISILGYNVYRSDRPK